MRGLVTGAVPPYAFAGGGAPAPGLPAGGFLLTFDDNDLVAGVLSVNHALNSPIVIIAVMDNNGLQIQPDDITFVDADNADVDLSSFAPIAGTWTLIAVGV